MWGLSFKCENSSSPLCPLLSDPFHQAMIAAELSVISNLRGDLLTDCSPRSRLSFHLSLTNGSICMEATTRERATLSLCFSHLLEKYVPLMKISVCNGAVTMGTRSEQQMSPEEGKFWGSFPACFSISVSIFSCFLTPEKSPFASNDC